MHHRLTIEEINKLIDNNSDVVHSNRKKDITIINPIYEFGICISPENKSQFIRKIPETLNDKVLNVSFNHNFLINTETRKYHIDHLYKDGNLIIQVENKSKYNLLINVRVEGFPKDYFYNK